jgi:aminoglycoside/choline kinase family phosphotransferase
MYRLTQGDTTMVGVANSSKSENDAFVALARHFKSHNLPVPKIYTYKRESCVYLEQYLGEITLLDYLLSERLRTNEAFPATVEEMYRKALSHLPRFQIEAAANLDFSLCLGSNKLFSQTLLHDMRSFAMELVGRLLPSYDTSTLERDFSSLVAFLERAPSSYFLYRDFQSRNIMLVENEPYFIDFQSGAQGPLQYDVISLLYQSSARIPVANRQSLVETYLHAVAHHAKCDREEFFAYYPAFIISRMLQVLGVYGRQGLGAQKEYFTKSIPAALATLNTELRSPKLGLTLEGLLACSDALLKSTPV